MRDFRGLFGPFKFEASQVTIRFFNQVNLFLVIGSPEIVVAVIIWG